jgi:hypothetical protein
VLADFDLWKEMSMKTVTIAGFMLACLLPLALLGENTLGIAVILTL